ncbi:MAG: KRRI-Interacting protein 1 [Thelocarpon impressellum]|nr:MAG: KRRI-Interacting protein 1 [Thelocarpon impressellum]
MGRPKKLASDKVLLSTNVLPSKSLAGMSSGSAESAHSRPTKKPRLMLDDQSSEDGEASGLHGGATLDGTGDGKPDFGFKINKEYARRFEHNKKREEMHRLEEKYGNASSSFEPRPNAVTRDEDDAGSNADDSSSNSEDEDDEAFLATEALDAEITATLQAIKSKDPRVYDETVTFYSESKDDVDDHMDGAKKDKPVFLRDYHRKNLLEGYIGEEGDESAPRSYAQEQDDLHRAVVKEMHAAANGGTDPLDDDEDGVSDNDGFLVPKAHPRGLNSMKDKAGHAKPPVEAVIALADKDPDSFLSNFMSSRAWVPTSNSQIQPFDSDDEEDDKRADAFEEAYNLRFEDPDGANEKLRSHARDAVAKYSVRRDEASGRKKVREAQREKKEAEARERTEEKARLRKLKLFEMEERVKRIKEAAGLRRQTIRVDEWVDILDAEWNDEKWESEMKKRFGDEYYAAAEEDEVAGVEDNNSSAKRKLKKPKWEDEINIKDLVPDFDDQEGRVKVDFALSDEDGRMEDESAPSKHKTKKNHAEERREQKKAARRERKELEDLVDDKLGLDVLPPTASRASGFRYRETSPLTYGLTPRDILMASDSQLNQYAGLKKLAAFRDAEKKRRDKKRLGKKARLRQWRKETFGNELGPAAPPSQTEDQVARPEGSNSAGLEANKKKRKRSGKGKEKSVLDA